MMMTKSSVLLALGVAALAVAAVEASVFLPQTAASTQKHGGARLFGSSSASSSPNKRETAARRELRRQLRRQSGQQQQRRSLTKATAMAIPGYGVAEQVFVGGFQNFLSVYNIVITARILLSWFPAAQGVGLLQPVYAITDPYLNLFRGLIPPIFGLDLSPILAFFLLSVLGNATAAVGAEIPANQPPPKSVFNSVDARREMVLKKIFRQKQQQSGDVLSLNY